MTDTILIVDDEESVRRTFQEWLASSGFGARVFAAADAESALRIANEHPVDLAVLDWNLGSGSDGLRLLEDLGEFRPDIVAILVTGFAHQATPLDALRMGVRDYLDKNTDLNRESFLRAVGKQLERIRPARRQRELNRSLAAFRETVEKVLPLVQTAAAFNDPVPLPEAVKSLVRLVIHVTSAADGALIVRHASAEGIDSLAAYGADGGELAIPPIPFARTLAASAASFQEPIVLHSLDPAALGPVDLLPFESGRRSVLAAALPVGADVVVVLELFDKPAPGFHDADRKLVAAAADVGTELLRQSMAERHTHRLLFDAVEAALAATASVTALSQPGAENPPPPEVIDRLRVGLAGDPNAIADAETTLKLVEAVRQLALRHGPAAVEHCVKTVHDLRALLDEFTGAWQESRTLP